MSTLELKELRISKIRHTDDSKLLAEIYRLLETKTIEPLILSEAQKNAIAKGQEDIKNGN